MPAIDILNLEANEGLEYMADLRLLFAGTSNAEERQTRPKY